MTKYAKLISETQIQFPPKNKGDIINYNLDIPQLIADGYKEFIEAEKEIDKVYTIKYRETETQILEIATEIPQPDPAEQREAQFNRDFFNTSLGYIRRNVTMSEGDNKDFLSDLLPSIAIAVNLGSDVTILAYDKPENFEEEITDWTQYQHAEIATPQFINECFIQLQNDFLPIN